jgi:hypothetical protein
MRVDLYRLPPFIWPAEFWPRIDRQTPFHALNCDVACIYSRHIADERPATYDEISKICSISELKLPFSCHRAGTADFPSGKKLFNSDESFR